MTSRPLSRRAAMLLFGVAACTLPPSGVRVAKAEPSKPDRKLKGPTFFVLGVFIAPPNEMRKWKARGVNTVVGVGQGVDADQHDGAARLTGLAQIRHPRPGKLAEDLADPSVIAFETDDEPTNFVDGHVRETPGDVTAEQKEWKAAAEAAGIVMPVFTNHIGAHIWQRNPRIGLDLAEYHKRSDWLGSDTYQIAAGDGNLFSLDGSTSTYQGQVLRLQRKMAPDAPLLAFLQTSAINTGKAVPTPGELKTQIWSSVVNGASMLATFPVRLTPTFAWDATPADLADTLTREFGEITHIEAELIDTAAGGARPARVLASADEGREPGVGQLPWPFESRLVDQPDGRRFAIVVNLADEEATFTHPIVGESRRFPPHDVWTGFVAKP